MKTNGSRSRRARRITLSLFPFLAVLMCALGALVTITLALQVWFEQSRVKRKAIGLEGVDSRNRILLHADATDIRITAVAGNLFDDYNRGPGDVLVSKPIDESIPLELQILCDLGARGGGDFEVIVTLAPEGMWAKGAIGRCDAVTPIVEPAVPPFFPGDRKR